MSTSFSPCFYQSIKFSLSLFLSRENELTADSHATRIGLLAHRSTRGRRTCIDVSTVYKSSTCIIPIVLSSFPLPYLNILLRHLPFESLPHGQQGRMHGIVKLSIFGKSETRITRANQNKLYMYLTLERPSEERTPFRDPSLHKLHWHIFLGETT